MVFIQRQTVKDLQLDVPGKFENLTIPRRRLADYVKPIINHDQTACMIIMTVIVVEY